MTSDITKEEATSPPEKGGFDNSASVVGSDEQHAQAGELGFEEATRGGMGRHLGITSTIFLIVGRIIGVGIFSTPSSVTESVGSVGAAMLLWLLGFLLAASGLAVWLELGSMLPRSGGEKVFLEAVYTKPKLLATVVFAVQAVALGFTASGCVVFASYVVVAAGHKATEWEERGIAISVLVFITLLHTFFPKWGVRGMDVLGVYKIILLLFIVVTGWVVLSGRISSIPDPEANFRNAFAGSATSSNLYAIGLFKVLNSFSGWSNAAYVANEIRNPIRTVKIAAPIGLGICGVLYMLANVAYYSAGTKEEIAHSGTTVASFFMGKVFGPAAEKALSALVAVSAFGNVLTITFAQSRVNQELAKEGVIPFPKFWASSWPFGSPSAGLLLHFIPSFIVIIAIPFGDAYDFIIDLEGYPSSVIYFFVVAGLFYLRWSAPNIHRPFKVWWPVAAFFMLGQAFQLVAPFIRPPGGKGDTSLPYWLSSVVGIVILVAAVVYWAVWQLVLPAIGGYRLVPEHEVLADGTTVVTYKKTK
ncbi:hypothetical protein N7468_007736 [Penicillium chermesinum]|uniref:High affinity methionine permease n=1 Tax=Penicillium chermesinum TaxID=63820 RepID=A0A9W9NVB8_9EURO|nr:uncharacterized protein N7468_007736 [Penicillium chermesinum]KAJ5226511.1 hypothetical protein N7468_007736 [Penicillium chermesinum]KAJ6160310.1 hypothetical protein N7470_003706 [Penicillium chermesinum]